MAAQPQRNVNTAFRNVSASPIHAARLVAMQPQPERKQEQAPRVQRRERTRRQLLSDAVNAQLAIAGKTLVVLAPIAGIGLVYLLGNVRVASEMQRAASVNRRLNQAKALNTYFLQQRTRLITPETIEQKALQQGMVRPDDSTTIEIR